MRRTEEPTANRRLGIACALAVSALVMLLGARAASADIVFGTSHGPGAGQTENPTGIAVDESDGTLYVADQDNHRVDVFDSTGNFLRAFGGGVADGSSAALQTCIATCFKGVAGAGGGQFNRPELVIVDNDPTSPSYRDLYVYDTLNRRVQRFEPDGSFVLAFGDGVNQSTGGDVCTAVSGDTCGAGTAGKAPGQFAAGSVGPVGIEVGPAGVVHVLDSPLIGTKESEGFGVRVQKFEPGGAFLEAIPLLENTVARATALAVDRLNGEQYVATGGSLAAVRRYDSSGVLLSDSFHETFADSLAVAPEGNLFVVAGAGAGLNQSAILEYDPAGAPVRTFYGGLEDSVRDIARYSSATGDVYALERSSRRILHISFPPPGLIVHPSPLANRASPVGNTKATLNAKINPEGEASTFHFEYVDEETYQESGFAEAKSSAETAVGSDFALHSVSAEVGCLDPADEGDEGKCLAPLTEYRFRVVAKSAAAPAGRVGPEASFTTLAPFDVKGTWSTEVGTDAAVLHAEVNPFGIPTTGRFQYVEQETFQESGFAEAAETTPVDFGAGNAPKAAAAQVQGLSPNTTYRYRIAVSDFFLDDFGPVHRFTTYPPRPKLKTDCPNQAFRFGPGAYLPDCRAYELVSPLEKNNGDIVTLAGIFLGDGGFGFPPARIDQAAPGGEKLTYSSYQAFAGSQSAHFASQYMAERDPDDGWRNRAINFPREGPSLYSQLGKEIPFKAFNENLCSSWFVQDTDLALVPGAPVGVPNLYRQGNGGAGCGGRGYELLTSVQPPGFGKASEGIDSKYYPMIGGSSADGAVSVFRADAKLTSNASALDIFQTYVTSEGSPLRLISVLPNGEAAATHSAVGTNGGDVNFRIGDVHRAVSSDASRVFWSATLEIGQPAHSEGGRGPSRLYVRLNASELQSQISGGKCTQPARACTLQVSAGAAGFQTADPEGDTAIFTEGGGLYEFDVDKAVAGEAATTLIAGNVEGVLGASEDTERIYLVSTDDLDGGGKAEAGQRNLYLREAGEPFAFVAALRSDDFGFLNPKVARVGPDGSHLVFSSRAPLTGYDNVDAAAGEPAAEVFLYDASDAKLRCISCNPSGARPQGGRNFGGEGGPGQAAQLWVVARIPRWETRTHPSRVLSEDGSRLFFESFEALVLRDTNGRGDVYEWEEASSKKDCEELGAELFVVSAGGCISLISSGESPQDAEFVDASADGRDVFFTTGSSFLPQDYGLVDIYDARAGGGYPPPPPPPPPCVGDACQSIPTPPIDPTPASASFRGAGDAKPRAGRRCRKGKRKVTRRGKVRCVKRKQKRRHGKRRARHHRRAAR